MEIGVLALQGAFQEHRAVLEKLGVKVREVRQVKDLDAIKGLVLPGGESTVQGKLLHELGLFEPCLLYTSPSPRDRQKSRMPSSA